LKKGKPDGICIKYDNAHIAKLILKGAKELLGLPLSCATT